MANPDWGTVDSKLVRKSPAHYEDGVYLMAETNRFLEKKYNDGELDNKVLSFLDPRPDP